MDQREVLDVALNAVDGNQAELARRLGRSETTISRWVTGRNGIDYESALRLARLTGLPRPQVIEACGLDPTLVPLPTPPPTDTAVDPDVAAIAAAWPKLEDGIRDAIKVLSRTAVSVEGDAAVSTAVSGRAKRGRSQRRNSGGPLAASKHTLAHAHAHHASPANQLLAA